VYVLVFFLVHHGDVPGFPFLASIIAIFSGAQLLSLGTVGEYIARMHTRLMGQPPYTVRGEVEGQLTTGLESELTGISERGRSS
jgi:hypothetical protein